MLYIVATPIGNLQDITIRAVTTLFSVKYILAEESSKTSIFLTTIQERYPELVGDKVKPKILSFNEFEEENVIPKAIALLSEGDVALVSAAGTPLISDPGFKLVREAVKRGHEVVSIPGASSVIAALSISGLPTNKFIFLGFLSKSTVKRQNSLKEVKSLYSHGETIVLFESPHRILELLTDMKSVFGDIYIVIAKELTKIHETVLRGKISEIASKLEEETRGEFVVMVNLKEQ
jgi:16S rRNA (cytidine1402-2'-O)-methyltransferase